MKRELVYSYYEAGKVPGHTPKTGLKMAEIGEYSDDQPSRLPRRPRGIYRKTHGRRYAPLRRALFSRIGQPWNRVFSELARIVPTGTLARQDILHMVRWEVKEHVRRGRDGLIYSLDLTIPYLVDGLYVDPSTGLLQKQDSRPKRKPYNRIYNPFRNFFVRMEEFRQIGPDSSAERENGIWYRFTYALHEPGQTYPRNAQDSCTEDAKPHWHRTGKRQLNFKELRSLGLRNCS